MGPLGNQELIAGAAVAAIFMSALMTSRLFRNVVLALAAGGLCYIYSQRGLAGLVALTKLIRADFAAQPRTFVSGLAIGAIVTAAVIATARGQSARRRRRR